MSLPNTTCSFQFAISLQLPICNFQFAMNNAMPTATATKPAQTRTSAASRQVIGSTFDAEFPENQLPSIYNAVKVESDQKGIKLEPDRRSAAAPRRRPRPLRGPGQHRRHGPRHGLHRHRLAGQGAGRQGHAGPRVQSASASRSTASGRSRPTTTGPSTAIRRPVTDLSTEDRNLRDRHQGDRSFDALRPRRQGRACSAGPDWARP